MSLSRTCRACRFYGNLLKNNLFGRKYDLYKIPGPPGYYLAGGYRNTLQPAKTSLLRGQPG